MNSALRRVVSEKLLTNMEVYSLDLSAIGHLKGREVRVLLPEGTQYSKGMIDSKTEGVIRRVQDLVSSSLIPISPRGSVDMEITWKVSSVTTDGSVTDDVICTNKQTAKLSISVLKKGISQDEYLASLKGVNRTCVSEDKNSVIIETPGFGFSSVEKTIVSDDIILKFTYHKYKFPSDDILGKNPMDQILQQISFVP